MKFSKAFVFFIILVLFSETFAKHIKKVKIKEVDLKVERKIVISDNEFLKDNKPIIETQKIEAQIPLIYFPYKGKIFDTVKKEIIDMTVPIVGDNTLLEFQSNYEVGINNGKIFSIKLFQYEYFFGAAHGNGEIVAINLDLRCKRFIKFFDIFAEKKHIYDEATKTYKEVYPLEEIKKILKEKIKNEKKCDIFEEEFNKCSYIPQIFLKKTGIEFIFSKYEVTPGVCGSFTIEIPYEDLRVYMRDDFDLSSLGVK